MLRKTKEQSSINFLGNDGSLTDVDAQNQKRAITEDEILAKLAEEQKSKRYSGKDDGFKNDKSVMSATCSPDVFSDMGGPSKQVHSSIANSIWDSDRLVKMKGEIDSKEASKAEKESMTQLRKKMEQERTDELVAGIQSTDSTKDSSVNQMNRFQGHKFISPTNNISIFDNGNFDRVPEKTAGETVADDNAQKRAQKDESWKNNGKAFSSKDVTNRLFDGLVNNLENKKG